ncbi:MAG: tetratricopeptide repeat protein [Planctomycetes bacterium]|nr:tetratricopeptide repeat protein [Planctomycetota bacterium]
MSAKAPGAMFSTFAERLLRRSLGIRRRLLGQDHTYTRLYTGMLIQLSEKTDQPDKAAVCRKTT